VQKRTNLTNTIPENNAEFFVQAGRICIYHSLKCPQKAAVRSHVTKILANHIIAPFQLSFSRPSRSQIITGN
jgi:hypothetical protein